MRKLPIGVLARPLCNVYSVGKTLLEGTTPAASPSHTGRHQSRADRGHMRRYAFAFALALTAAVHAAGPESKYKTPRTADGQPDLQGVWNFSSDVPLERPAKFSDRKFFTTDEIAQLRIAKDKALATIASFVPVEDVGLTLLDHTSYVQDLRTSLIT